jgi:phosphatidylglycerophosphatase A
MPELHSAKSRTARLIATVFGLGDVLPAPGTTAGSFPATIAWLALCSIVTTPTIQLILTAAGALAFTLIGVWASRVEAHRRGTTDPGPIVIDEVAGQWLCFAGALPFVNIGESRVLLAYGIIGFLAFRFFDIVKPWPARQLEPLGGGAGIIADDLAAGLQAALVLIVVFRVIGIGAIIAA